jgi:DNA repair exonuclease SbcCD nuclease subunit
MFRFVHAADIHLDSPLLGLARYEGAPVEQVRQAGRRALENLVELVLGEGAEFLLLAGDLYDGDWKDYNTGLFFCRQMARLAEAGVVVFAVAGNHDAASSLTARLHPPDNVCRLSASRPETRRIERLGVAVHGRSYPEPAVTEDLAAGLPPAEAGLFNIGLLHTSLDGRPGHERYAPCRLDGLCAHGYDYWALGHVHAHEVVHREPHVVFPGCLQGRHARETGPKGACLVTVADGAVTALEHRPLDVLRWVRCEVELDAVAHERDLLDTVRAALAEVAAACSDRPLAVRVVLQGASPCHARLRAEPERWTQQVRELGLEVGADRLWVEKVVLATRARRSLAAALAEDTAVGALLRDIEGLQPEDADVAGLDDEIAALRPRLAQVGLDEEDDPTAAATRAAIVAEARDLLVARLLEQEDEER